MSLRALHSAASGMDANAFNLDTIANNLANAGTTAFKRTRANFEDLFYEHLKLPGSQDPQGGLTPVGISVGLGTRIAGTQVDHGQGAPIDAPGELNLAILGNGFFPIQGNGEIFYTRAGAFSLNAEGSIVMASADNGRLLDPSITIPPETEQVTITSAGIVTVKLPGQPVQEVGQIQLARFVNPQGLIQVGENLFAASTASGPVTLAQPGQQGTGSLKQHFLEISNVEPVRELVDLIKTQRNFELNSQTIQAADQMLQLIANLRRF